MWILIIVIVIFVIFQFLISKNQVGNKIAKQGGMRNKYRRLVELIMALHPSTRIVQEGSDYLTIRASDSSGYTEMQLIQNLNHLVVKWKTESNVFGTHNMKWEFYEFDDQDKMIKRINNDTTKYTENILASVRSSVIEDHIEQGIQRTIAGYSKDAETLCDLSDDLSDFIEVHSFGTISVADPAFAGRRQGEFGEYLQLRTEKGELMFVSVAKDTPKGVSEFAIKELEVTVDFEIDGKTIEAGTISFKAYAVVTEEIDDEEEE